MEKPSVFPVMDRLYMKIQTVAPAHSEGFTYKKQASLSLGDRFQISGIVI